MMSLSPSRDRLELFYKRDLPTNEVSVQCIGQTVNINMNSNKDLFNIGCLTTSFHCVAIAMIKCEQHAHGSTRH